MTQGSGFLLAMLLEGAAAAALGWLLARHLGLSRHTASLRCCAASVIGTAATHPVLWLWLSRWNEVTGSWWGGTASALCLVILMEGMFFAAALRGHWRIAYGLSTAVNMIGFGAALPINWLLARPA